MRDEGDYGPEADRNPGALIANNYVAQFVDIHASRLHVSHTQDLQQNAYVMYVSGGRLFS
jgi:hypothetical protein